MLKPLLVYRTWTPTFSHESWEQCPVNPGLSPASTARGVAAGIIEMFEDSRQSKNVVRKFGRFGWVTHDVLTSNVVVRSFGRLGSLPSCRTPEVFTNVGFYSNHVALNLLYARSILQRTRADIVVSVERARMEASGRICQGIIKDHVRNV